jgi:hypothetical protein
MSLEKELHGMEWRILPLDAKPEDKFNADMVFESIYAIGVDTYVATGYVYSDSRGVFPDGSPVRTSPIKNVYAEANGTQYIETRNTIYKIIG